MNLRKTLVIPVVGALAAAVLSACGGSDKSGSAAGGGDATINWAYTTAQTNWDPVVVGATGATQLLSTVYEPLFTLDEQGQIKPALATGYEYAPDGKSLTITLRDGLTFQDGSPLDADAVAFNINRIQTQQNSALKAVWAAVASTNVIDATHLQINLTEPNYQFAYVLANRSSLLASKKAAEADPEKLNSSAPVGAGPFKVVKLVPDASITLEKWDGYWDANDIKIKKFNITFNADPATILSGLQTGAYNFSTNFPTQSIEGAKKAGLDVNTDQAAGWALTFINLNVNQPPFNDPLVVQAINHAVDRQAFVDQLTFGTGKVTVQPFPSTSPAYNPALEDEEQFAYDPQKAKDLLKQAGHESDLSIDIDMVQGLQSGAGELLQQQLAAVGIKAKIVSQTIDEFYKGYYGKTDSLALYGYVGRDSKLIALDEHYGPKGILNLSAPTTSDVYAAARAKVLGLPLDDPSYQETLQAATKAGTETGTTISLYSYPNIYAKAADISDLPKIDGSFRWNGVTVGGK